MVLDIAAYSSIAQLSRGPVRGPSPCGAWLWRSRSRRRGRRRQRQVPWGHCGTQGTAQLRQARAPLLRAPIGLIGEGKIGEDPADNTTGSHRNQRSDSCASVRASVARISDASPPRPLAGPGSQPPHSSSPRPVMVDAQWQPPLRPALTRVYRPCYITHPSAP
jgi:hypothetical protein